MGRVRFLTLYAFFLCVVEMATAQNAADFNNLGIASYNAGQFQAAIAYFEKAYELASENPTVRRNLCNAHQGEANRLAQQSDFAAAARHLELAIAVDPQNPAPLIQLGSYYLRLDMVSDAIFRLEEAIELKPGDLDAHELLGRAYYEDNDLPSARAQWDYVLAMAPDRPGLKELYAKAFREEAVESGFGRQTGKNFKISFPKEVPYQLRTTVLRLLESAYREIGRRLGDTYPPEQVQVVLYAADQFSEATQLGAHVGAVFDGKIRCPITDAEGRFLSEQELEKRLRHEYVHVLVRFIAGNKVPWWLNEGMAEVFSNTLEPEQAVMLSRAYAEGLAFKVSDLEGSQLQRLSPEALRLAYLQSQAAVQYLYERGGARKLVALLGAIGTGTPPEEALRVQYRRTYAQLDTELGKSYRQ